MGVKERRARSKENLREEILECARALFVKDGYDRVSIRQIADKIEYSPGTIYLHFKDKAEIFRTLCDETFGKLHRRLLAIAEDSGPPLDKLRRAGRAYVQFALENQSHYLLVFLAPNEMTLSWESDTHDVGALCFGDLCNIVQQCIDADLLRSQDVNEISQSVWASVHGISALLITKSQFPFIEHTRLIERVIDMSVEGVRKP